MSKLNLAVIGILLFAGIASADVKPTVNGSFMPEPQVFQSGAVYISSDSCADNSSVGPVSISSYPALLHTVTITSAAASASSVVQLFDSKYSTSIYFRTLTPPLDARSAGQGTWIFDVGASSGIAIKNQGGACVSVIYVPR